ncbi:unnamed protein product [Gadus morhua 'NCC']
MCFQGGAPNYFPCSFSAPDCQPCFLESKFKVSPDVTRYNSANDDNYTQAGTFYSEVLSEEERRRLCQNLAGALKGAQVFIQERMVQHLMAIHPDYGKQVQSLLTKHNAEAQKNSNVHVYTRPTAINASAKMDPDTVVTIVNPVEHPRDYVVWSICSFFHANPFCLGLLALIFSFKARDMKVIGDLQRARGYSQWALGFNVAALIILFLTILILVIVFGIIPFSSYLINSY